MFIIRSLILGTVLLAGVTTAAELRSHEQPIETSTMYLHLPTALPGSISLAPCESGCSSIPLQINADTLLMFGRKQLSLIELRKVAANPNLNVAVFFDTRTRVITRLVLSPRRG
jgi:hypothetical protein